MQNKTQKLETIPGKYLLTRPSAPLEFTIGSILPHSLFILAGSPKVGKSWLALDMCCAVVNGSNLWSFSASHGDVLYLALEDNHTRLHDRLSKVLPAYDLDASNDIHFATHAQKLGDGLSEQLTGFLDEHSNTKLIIIDTMQYIRKTGNFSGTYAQDYHDINTLRKIISNHKLTLLLITHTRKTGDSDPLNLISGSTGLSGAVDGVFILEKDKRIDNMARLTIANRDTESYQFELRFDRNNCRWQFVSEIKDDDEDEKSLYDLLNYLLDKSSPWLGTATQLCEALFALEPSFSLTPIALSKILKQQQEYLKLQYGITCNFTRNKSARFIELVRDNIVAICEDKGGGELDLVI